MTVTTHLSDPNGNIAKVDGEGAQTVTIHPHPPLDETVLKLPFRVSFSEEDTAATDMSVDGSTVPIEFCILAIPDFHIYIKTLSIRIGDSGASLAQFGAIGVLTNGVDWMYETQESGNIDIAIGLQTNLDFIRLASGSPSFGDGTSAFRADTTGSGQDTYLPSIDMSQTFGYQYGLRLRANTRDKLCFVVNDDLTAVDSFDIIGRGFRISDK